MNTNLLLTTTNLVDALTGAADPLFAPSDCSALAETIERALQTPDNATLPPEQRKPYFQICDVSDITHLWKETIECRQKAQNEPLELPRTAAQPKGK